MIYTIVKKVRNCECSVSVTSGNRPTGDRSGIIVWSSQRSIYLVLLMLKKQPQPACSYLVYIDIIHNVMNIYQRSTVSYIYSTHLRQFTLRLDSTFHVESNLYHHVALECIYSPSQFNSIYLICLDRLSSIKTNQFKFFLRIQVHPARSTLIKLQERSQ